MILLDFDGTLVDLWTRYHRVFCDLSGIDISLQEYREAKRKIKNDADMAYFFHKRLPKDYFEKKAIYIEDLELLKLDKLLLPQKKILKLFEDSQTILLTKRRNSQHLLHELNYLGLEKIKNQIVVCNSKLEWAEENCRPDQALIIGDSIQDLDVGVLANILPIMVMSGLGTKTDYDERNIRYICYDTIEDAYDFILEWQKDLREYK